MRVPSVRFGLLGFSRITLIEPTSSIFYSIKRDTMCFDFGKTFIKYWQPIFHRLTHHYTFNNFETLLGILAVFTNEVPVMKIPCTLGDFVISRILTSLNVYN